MRSIVLTKDSGNLLEEGLPISKDLLEECLERGIFIDATSGDYGYLSKLHNCRRPLIEQIILPLYELYIAGEMSLKTSSLALVNKYATIADTLKRKGFKMLSKKESSQLYKDEKRRRKEATCLELYGVDNPMQSDEFKNKRNETCLERCGAANPMQVEEIKERRDQTNIELYGNKCPAANPEVRAKVHLTNLLRYGAVEIASSQYFLDKRVETWMINYGVDHCIKSKDVQDKRKDTLLSRYNVTCSMLLPYAREKARETWIANYGVDNPFKSPTIQYKVVTTNIKKYGVPYVLTITASNVPQNEAVLRWTAVNSNPSYETILESSYSPEMYHYLLRKHNIEVAGKFKTELNLRHLLKTLDCKFCKNARKTHGVRNSNGRYYELDAYIPELKLGIEINGKAFHSVNKVAKGDVKTPEYHFEKFKAFRESGILMLSFTDYEQEHFKSDYENIIKHHLLGEPLNVSKEFLEFNQISRIEESLNYGLFDANQFTGDFEDHQHQRFIEDYEYWDCGIIRNVE